MRLLIFLSVIFLITESNAQNSLVSYGGSRYGAGSCLFRDYQCMGVNPANLGIFTGEQVQVNMSFFDGNGLFFSDALPKTQIVQSLLGGHSLSTEEKLSVAQQFLESGNTFSAELDPFNISVQFPKLGGFGFSWRERMTGGAKLSHPLADIFFNGLNSDYIDTIVYDVVGQAIGIVSDTINPLDLFNGSSFQYNWLREFNLSFGRKILGSEKGLALYAGGSVKFLQSNGISDIAFDADTISGFAAFSKIFNIDYANFTNPDIDLKGDLSPVGRGVGYDFGVTLSLSDKLLGAISITDIGKVKYAGNIVSINGAIEDSLLQFIGLDAADIFTDLKNVFNADGLLSYLPAQEKTVNLPTQLHIGGAWRATSRLDLAFDVMQPFNKVPGSSQKTIYSALANVAFSKVVKVSGGFTGGGIANFDVPLGIAFSFVPDQIWQISIGTGDIVSIVTQDKPTISLNVSLFRLHYE